VLPGRKYGPEDFLRIAWQRKWVIALPAALVAAATVMYARALPDIFRSETTILIVPQRVPESYVRATVTSRIEDRLGSLRQQILSRGKLEPLVLGFHLYESERAVMPMEAVVERMRQAINVDIVRDDAFSIGYVSTDPVAAKTVAERLASLFIQENTTEREVLAEGTNQFLETQLEGARRRLEDHEAKLADYRRRYAGALPSQLDSNVQILNSLNLQAQGVANDIARDRDALLVIERSLSEAAAAAAATTERTDASTQGASAADRLAAAKATLDELRTRLKPEHPDIIAAQRLVADLERKAAAGPPVTPTPRGTPTMSAAVSRRLDELRTQRENLTRQIERKQEEEARIRNEVTTYQARVEDTPARESELTALTRDYETLQNIYTGLLAKKEDAAIAANLERRQIGEQFKVLDAARVPQRPFSPNRVQINAVGSFGGLMIGLLLAALLEYRDSTVKSEEDVRMALALPVLAAIPLLATDTPMSGGRLGLTAGRLARALTGGTRES
jgi:polysaccharide chain length determinant protein (PEP-CTERM system associated)